MQQFQQEFVQFAFKLINLAVRSAPSSDSEATLSRTLNSAIKNHEIKELRDKVAKEGIINIHTKNPQTS